MDIQESVKVCLMEKYVTFSGRASRSEFWWFMLACTIFNMVVGTVTGGLGMILSLAILVPSLAAGSRRLHDIGKSEAYLLLALVPLVNLILLYWCAQPSQPEANQYGEVPVK